MRTRGANDDNDGKDSPKKKSRFKKNNNQKRKDPKRIYK